MPLLTAAPFSRAGRARVKAGRAASTPPAPARCNVKRRRLSGRDDPGHSPLTPALSPLKGSNAALSPEAGRLSEEVISH